MEGPGGGLLPFCKGKGNSPGGAQVLWRGQGEPSVMVPPRPLQATPTPSSGFGVTFAPLPAIGVCRAGHGRIKEKALIEAQSALD